ncbi:tetratricopeptide repeat protein [Chloroflexota bacterium]
MRNLITLALTGLVLIIGLIAALNISAHSSEADIDAVSIANKLYESGQYDQATQIYQQIISQGVQDSAIYYNMGNVYYKQGDLGRAIVNYERAALLNPRDSDIQANLTIARNHAEQSESLPAIAKGPVDSISRFIGGWFSIDETAILALGLWFTFSLLFLVWLQLEPGKARTWMGYSAFMTLLLVAVLSLSLGNRIYSEKVHPTAVVVANEITINSQPGDLYATEKSLHNGAEVILLGTQGDWAHLATPGETLEGWIPLSAVEYVL